MKQRGFTHILTIIIILILVGGIAYYFGVVRGKSAFRQGQGNAETKTTVPAGWKVYNSESGFVLYYPSDFIESSKSTTDEFIAESSNFRLSIKNNLKLADVNSSIDRIKEDISEGVPDQKKEFVLSEEAYFGTIMSAEGILERNIYITLSESVIQISLSADTRLKGNEEPEIITRITELADQIFSTFGFIVE